MTTLMFEIRQVHPEESFGASAAAPGINMTLTASAAPTVAPAAPNIPAGHAAALG